MNKIYRLVWNSAQRAWVVAGEFAAAKGKGKTSPRRLASTAAGLVGAVALSMTPVEDARAYVAGGGNDSGIAGNIAIGGGATAVVPPMSSSTGNNIALGDGALAGSSVVWGGGTQAGGAVAIGHEASATGVHSNAIGYIAKASGNWSTAIGPMAIASGNSSSALGDYASATGDSAFAGGAYANASGAVSTALGGSSNASGWSSVAVARNSVASGDSSAAFGYNSSATGEISTALGYATSATARGALALGSGAKALGAGSVAAGNQTEATADGASALGDYAHASGAFATGLGYASYANGQNSIAAGRATAAGSDSIALGTDAGAGSAISAYNSIAIGNSAGQRVTSPNNIAMGTASGQDVTSSQNVAIGDGSGNRVTNTTGNTGSSVAIGRNVGNDVNGESNLAFGSNSGNGVVGGSNVAMGTDSGKNVTGNYNLALGRYTADDVIGDYTTSIGFAAGTATKGNDNTNIGSSAGRNVAGNRNVAIGYQSGASVAGDDAVSIGTNALASVSNSVAMGTGAKSSQSNSVAIGSGSMATGGSSMAMGTSSTTAGIYTIAIGDHASASSAVKAGAIALGVESNASYDGATAIGANSVASKLNAVAIGRTAKAQGISSVALGDVSQATGDSGVAIGGGSLASGDTSTSVGWYTKSTGDNALAFGNNSTASGTNSAVIGTKAKASGTNSLAIGYVAQATGVNSISIGTGNVVSGNNSAAIGDPSVITGTGSYSLGNNNTVNADNAFVVGSNVTVGTGLNGSVVLGNNSTVSAAVGTSNTTIADKTYNFAGIAPVAAMSVGALGAERTITNVAAGRLSSTSTDAINGSQLYATNSAIKVLDDGAVKYDINPDKTVNYNSVTLGGDTYNNITHTGGTTITNVANGVAPSDAVNFSQLTETNNTINNIYNTGTKYFHANSTGVDSSATGMDAVAIGMGAVSDVARSIALGDGAKTEAAIATTGTRIADKDYVFAGTAPVGTLSVGKAGEERTITNVAAGRLSETSTDAVNGSQLYATNSAIKVLDEGAVKYDINLDKTVNYNSVTMGGTTYDNSTHIGGTTITNVADGVAPSDAVNFSQLTETNTNITNIYNTGTKYFHANSTGTDSSATAVDAIAIGMGAVADVDRSIALGDGAKTEAAIATTGTTIADKDYVFAGTAPVGTLSIGQAGQERTITNVAAGRLSETSTDAVNGSQLYATNSAITKVDDRAVKYDINTTTGEVNYNNITLGGDTYDNSTHTGGTTITNVADGVAPSDAVNFSQLNEINIKGTKYFHANSTGVDSSATAVDAIAIGMGAVADVDRSIALGDGAKTEAAIATTGTRIADKDYVFAGTAPVGTLSIGKDGEERTITNVAAGRLSETSTDAVNGSQLYATNSAITKVDDRAVKYDINTTTGEVNYNNITLGGDTYDNSTHTGGTTITNVANGVAPSDAVNFSQLTEINIKGTKYFHANSTGTDSSATAVDAIAIGMGAVADVDRSIALGDGAKTEAAIATTGTKIADKDYVFAGTAPVGTLSIGKDGEERTITNVAAGRLSETSTDAVNGSQLFASNTAIDNINTTVINLDNRSVKYDINLDKTVNYNSITLGGTTYDNSTHIGGTTITNVADGTAPSDAVNFSQLTETNNTINNIYNTGTKYFHANSTGVDSSATGMDAVAIGMGAVSEVARSIALGDGAKTEAAVGTAGTTIAGTDYAFAGTAPVGTLSIGKAGEERTITNVAAGRLSETSTDAVNGSQLFATNTAIDNISTTVINLDNRSVKYDTNTTTGEVNYNSITLGGDTYDYSTHTGGTTITNVAEGDVNEGSSDAINGSQFYDVAGDTSNTYINKNGRGIRYVRTNDTDLPLADAHAEGQASTAVGYNATATAASSIAMGQDSLASATNSVAIGKDAVASDANSVALGNGAKTAPVEATTSMTIRGDTYAVAGDKPTGTVSVGDAGEERTITNVAAGRVTATSTDAVNGSQLYATVEAINNISSDISDLGDAAVKYDKNADGTVNYNQVTLAGGPTTITNVAAGTQDSDAVNYSQLKNVSNDVTNISNGTDGMFQVNNTSNLPKPSVTGQDAAAGGAGAVASGDNSLALGTKSSATANNSIALGSNSVADRANTVSVGSAGAERQITNVAAGTNGTDAVNVNQLKDGINTSNQYTNNKFNSLKNMVDDQGDKLSAGIAGAMAMAGLPQAYQPGASMVAIAGSTYQDQSAVALGVSVISDNGKWVTKLSGSTNSKGDLGGAVGVGYQW